MKPLARVLYLSYDGLTDPLGQSQILPYVKGLSKVGYVFTVISFEKEELFHKSEKAIRLICDEYSILWIPLMYHKSPPVLSTLYDIGILWQRVKQNYDTFGFEIIHCRSYITSLIGLRARKKWGTKFVFDMRGFWADERVEGGLWKIKNPLFKFIYQYFKKKEKEFLIRADHIISLTHNAKQEIESWKLNHAQITVIPTCVDLNHFDPSKIKKIDRANLREKLGIEENDFVLLYLGSWGTWYLVKEMLDFFTKLKKKTPEAKFLILSTDKIDLENFIHKKEVIIISVQRALVPLYISITDLSICFIKPSFSKKASSATKVGEILAMNVPVVVNEGWGDVEEMANGECGVFLLDENLLQKITSPVLASESRMYCYERLGLETGIKQYKQVYDLILRQ